MKNLRNFALAAFALLGFAACQQEEFAPEIKNPTHSVTFVAGAPETKTTATIEGNTVNYKWTKDDEGRFTVYENGIPATDFLAELGSDGKMSMTATFTGDVPASPKYQALYNSEVSATQIVTKNSYVETSDVMVSNVLDGTRDDLFVFSFKREVAFAKMTLKGLTSGAYVSSVTIESDKPIAGQYDLVTGTFINTSNVITLDVLADVADGQATVWFTTIPVADATFTITAKTTDDAETVAGTYTKTFTKTITLTRGDVKAFGVAMVKDIVVTPNETYNRITSQSEFEEGEYVIGMALNSEPNTIKYLVNTTKAKPGCTDITGDISISEDGKTINLNPTTITNAKWLIESVEGGFSISSMTEKPAGLATTTTSDGLTTQTTYLGTAWSITVNGETNACTMKYVPTSRYLNVYSLENPRTYTSSTTNNSGNIYLYKKYDPRTTLATPTNLTVSAEKLVSWDVVNGAKSYVLTIGTEEYPCLSNSYNASAIADEYYDVAVVAVPSDTEIYKNSVAATLTDAKFGTPTLKTPTLNEGAVDEFSVNATWTVDSRATEGYNCELYNGEIKVGDSKTVNSGSVTFEGLDDGVTYTVKVNAKAVEGNKSYAASDVATIQLTTKGTVTLSQITEAGTYTVKNVTVYAVIGKSTAVIGDGTAYFYMYKSNHGLAVGNTFTIGGTVKEYDGVLQFNNPTISNKATGSTPSYENPVEADEAYLTSYASAPVTEYIHAKGTQSGKSISIGSQILYLSAANAETDGRDVEVYGFVYGYSSSYKNAYFYATSIAEDLTAPKLSVTPTSKTWASEETDAAIFTVTTNTEGVNGWSVSPTTLDWATIDVDKANGTITVTPKDANTAETSNEATLIVSHSAGTLSKTITLTQSPAGSTTYTALFGSTYNSKAISSYSSSWYATNDEFTVDLVNWNNNNNNWNYIKAGSKNAASVATITTKTAISEAITKVSITIDAVTASSINSITLYCGDKADACTTSLGTFTIATGEQSVIISSPTSKKFYKISADCKQSSNGTLTVSKVVYTNN